MKLKIDIIISEINSSTWDVLWVFGTPYTADNDIMNNLDNISLAGDVATYKLDIAFLETTWWVVPAVIYDKVNGTNYNSNGVENLIATLEIPNYAITDFKYILAGEFSEKTEELNIVSSYAPIIIDFEDTGNSPVVYCDVYFDGIYYKTLSKTTPEYLKTYRFDISNASQEYLKSELAPINGVKANVPENYFAKCFCKIRTSVFDANGFIDQEKPIPIQETEFNEPVSGGGIELPNFYILNCVLQHENNPDLKKHLASFINYSVPSTVASRTTLPLTHRPKNYKVCANSSDYFSIVSSSNPYLICVSVVYKDGSVEEFCTGISIKEYSENKPIGSNVI